jgi:hypothetical protein
VLAHADRSALIEALRSEQGLSPVNADSVMQTVERFLAAREPAEIGEAALFTEVWRISRAESKSDALAQFLRRYRVTKRCA